MIINLELDLNTANVFEEKTGYYKFILHGLYFWKRLKMRWLKTLKVNVELEYCLTLKIFPKVNVIAYVSLVARLECRLFPNSRQLLLLSYTSI
jgi:hypothetical protein